MFPLAILAVKTFICIIIVIIILGVIVRLLQIVHRCITKVNRIKMTELMSKQCK